jgi:hypothetical protein
MSAAVEKVMAAFVKTHKAMTVKQDADVRAEVTELLRQHSELLGIVKIARS